uniref:Uncharacterized protein n=1 Tax=Lotharella oceanica TaxID=641309 RepID=A0A7S2U1I2_9EUKA|mmetsp:Transcript_36997/g.68285  ORF Transcript_36997/g.68285 Transcript_36997/m.68285 type:complete len:465 (+) Transcript_36997:173-1567(+)
MEYDNGKFGDEKGSKPTNRTKDIGPTYGSRNYGYDTLHKDIGHVEDIIRYHFRNKTLLVEALTRRAFVCDNVRHLPGVGSNARLEFLGDALLGFYAAEIVYKFSQCYPEGTLTNLRSLMVSNKACAGYMRRLGLGGFILRGECERICPLILANVFEAIVGAIYLDGGMGAAQQFLQHAGMQRNLPANGSTGKNARQILHELCQAKAFAPPKYQLVQKKGPEHAPIFTVRIQINGRVLSEACTGMTRKEAEYKCAQMALDWLKQEDSPRRRNASTPKKQRRVLKKPSGAFNWICNNFSSLDASEVLAYISHEVKVEARYGGGEEEIVSWILENVLVGDMSCSNPAVLCQMLNNDISKRPQEHYSLDKRRRTYYEVTKSECLNELRRCINRSSSECPSDDEATKEHLEHRIQRLAEFMAVLHAKKVLSLSEMSNAIKSLQDDESEPGAKRALRMFALLWVRRVKKK